MTQKKHITEKWEREKKAVRATQMAFDVGEKVQQAIRREAVNRNLAPSDCIRSILGLKTLPKPKRLRLSVSLSESDFIELAARFGLDPDDKLGIKQQAAQLLIKYAQQSVDNDN
ncbi:MAG: hypothetical protein CR974_03660 [Gammaproteobacteria bacterium]|nr:MAG: hypothetical protein CR974_03660 [Gammaproteobacteria bacterium]